MSNIDWTDWKEYELYPALFECIDVVFPEQNFKRCEYGWRSQTYLDGTPHKDRKDKTVITKQVPNRILEQGGDNLSLIDYVMQRDNVSFIDAAKKLAEIACIELPKYDFNQEQYQSYKQKTTLLEYCQSYFAYCLGYANGGDKVRSYLENRGYTEQDIEEMKLGYIPSQDELFEYLQKKQIEDLIQLHPDIGKTHILTIPYRVGGVIKGFKFRNIGDDTPKYLNSTGLEKLSGFFNLSGFKSGKDIVVVEGELDSLYATAKGIHNVVSMTGISISVTQVKDAVRRGVTSFTLCFDRDVGKEADTASKVIKAISVILDCQVSRVYIITLPALNGQKVDADSFIREKGAAAFKQLIREAVPYWKYKLQVLIDSYKDLEVNGELCDRDIDNLLTEFLSASSRITHSVDRDRYTELFLSNERIKELGIAKESISIEGEKLTAIQDKERQDKVFKKLLEEATDLQKKGDTEEAIDLVYNRVKEVKSHNKNQEFSELLVPVQEEQLRERLHGRVDDVESGYKIRGEELLLPSGAISVFAAPTSHGKTTLLINLAINVAKKYDGKEVHFFSCEEDSDTILLNAFNVYANIKVGLNNRKSIRTYFSVDENSSDMVKYVLFHDKKEESRKEFVLAKNAFFNDLIGNRRLKIHYNSYDTDTLTDAIRYIHKHGKPAAIFIDYMQLLFLNTDKNKKSSRQEELKNICLALKDLAIEIGLPIVLGAQFNREVNNPLSMHVTKIGEAGDIERIAHLVVGFWNNSFKGISKNEKQDIQRIEEIFSDREKINRVTIVSDDCTEQDGVDAHICNLYTTVLKNRAGRAGHSDSLIFNKNTGKISSQEVKETEVKEKEDGTSMINSLS